MLKILIRILLAISLMLLVGMVYFTQLGGFANDKGILDYFLIWRNSDEIKQYVEKENGSKTKLAVLHKDISILNSEISKMERGIKRLEAQELRSSDKRDSLHKRNVSIEQALASIEEDEAIRTELLKNLGKTDKQFEIDRYVYGYGCSEKETVLVKKDASGVRLTGYCFNNGESGAQAVFFRPTEIKYQNLSQHGVLNSIEPGANGVAIASFTLAGEGRIVKYQLNGREGVKERAVFTQRKLRNRLLTSAISILDGSPNQITLEGLLDQLAKSGGYHASWQMQLCKQNEQVCVELELNPEINSKMLKQGNRFKVLFSYFGAQLEQPYGVEVWQNDEQALPNLNSLLN